MGCESEGKEERRASERDRYAEKRSACGGLLFKCQNIEKAEECCAHAAFYALMFISGSVGL